MREADGFRAQGLWHDHGLGNVLFGSNYPEDGFKADGPEVLDRSVGPGGVYTHYPPGPEWLLYAAQSVLGAEPLARARMLPLLVSAAGAVAFGLAIRRRFGEGPAWAAMLLTLAAVPFYSANASIHGPGYVQALLLLELALCLAPGTRRWALLPIGFAQGWLSFDAAFLVAGLPLAVAFAMPLIQPVPEASPWPRLRIALIRCGLAGFGFTLAHALHLAQIAAFYGTFAQAIADLGGSASYRSGAGAGLGATLETLGAVLAWHLGLSEPAATPLLPELAHLFAGGMNQPTPIRTYRILGLAPAAFCAGVALLALLGPRNTGLFRRWAGLCAIGLGLSSLWWVAMPSHGAIHPHLHYRHFNVAFALWAIFLAVHVHDRVRAQIPAHGLAGAAPRAALSPPPPVRSRTAASAQQARSG